MFSSSTLLTKFGHRTFVKQFLRRLVYEKGNVQDSILGDFVRISIVMKLQLEGLSVGRLYI